jgi:two-component system LytT family response regulator
VREDDPLRVLVVDDEALARDLVCELLDGMPRVRVVGRCGDGMVAVDEIGRLGPDLVLLDVQMPEVDGFDVLQRIGPDAMPEVVFVTAHEEYMLRAFRVHALDYVLKPVDPARLEDAVRHARRRIASGRRAALVERLEGLLEEVDGRRGSRRGAPRRITVQKGEAIRFIEVEELTWLEAARNYVRLHAGDETFLVRSSLKDLLSTLGEGPFLRIHRSAAVNLEKVDEIRPLPGGDYAVRLLGGERLRASRTYADALLRLTH